jgi:two-component sensor histidine kinase
MAEEKVNALLQEKELLLREVHHRVKNNMNSMASLLSLQAANMQEPTAIKALHEAQVRLKSMGVLYDKIYRSENLAAVSIREYLPTLLAEIVRIFPSSVEVKTDIELEDFMLEVRIMMPLGIVVNEIITNSLKYAFRGRSRGTINAKAFSTGSQATIVIGDDGIGIPASIDVENSSGFGLTLIKALMDQIDGSVRIDTTKGTAFILEFGLGAGSAS